MYNEINILGALQKSPYIKWFLRAGTAVPVRKLPSSIAHSDLQSKDTLNAFRPLETKLSLRVAYNLGH